MSLPKTPHPIVELQIPSTKKKELFRPMLVGDEKILLIAKTSGEILDMFRSIKQVVNNCALSDNFNIDKCTLFDMEYLFLQLRAASINNISKITYIDNEDQKEWNFSVDLTKIVVKFPSEKNDIISLSDDGVVGMKMKYPSASIFDDNTFFTLEGENSFFELIIRCIDKIYDGEEIFDIANYTNDELKTFIENQSLTALTKIKEFMNSIPKLSYIIKYTNSLGNDKEIELKTLTDFFTLG